MNLNNEQLIHLYSLMVRTRKFDILMCDGIRQGKLVSFFHSGQGEEASRGVARTWSDSSPANSLVPQ